MPGPGVGPRCSPGVGSQSLAQRWGPSPGVGSKGWGPSPGVAQPLAQGWGPSQRVAQPLAQGWGPGPGVGSRPRGGVLARGIPTPGSGVETLPLGWDPTLGPGPQPWAGWPLGCETPGVGPWPRDGVPDKGVGSQPRGPSLQSIQSKPNPIYPANPTYPAYPVYPILAHTLLLKITKTDWKIAVTFTMYFLNQ